MKNVKAILAVGIAAAIVLAASPLTAGETEYLPKLSEKAQDSMRAGLKAALKPLPKCNQHRLLKNGACCPMGYASLGERCARIAPATCANVAIENPSACKLTQCARYIREVPAPKMDKKGKPMCKLDAKGKPIPKKDEEGNPVEGQCEVEMGTKEVPCQAWKSGVRDLTCLLDTYECKKAELASGPTRWCGDWMKKITVPPTLDDEGNPVAGSKPFDKFIRCQAGSEGCDQVVRECTGQELTSNKSEGFGPCKIGEYVNPKNNTCTKYTCPKHCTTPDGRCAACGPDYISATKYFQEAYSADDHFYEAYFNHAMALEKLGRYEEAVAIYQKAAGVSPNNARERSLQLSAKAFMARSKVSQAKRLLEAGEKQKAESLLTQARSVCESIRGQDPDNVVANNVLALYWLEKNDLKLAENFIKQVLRVDRENTIALNVRGLINLRTKKNEIVKWILGEKVLAIDPANPEAFANLGLAYVRLGDLPRAVVAFEKAVKLKPNSVAARLNLGAIYMEYLNYKQAERQYGAALKLEGNNLEALTGYALAMEGMRNPKKAAELYEKVLSKDKTRHALLVRLALIYEKAPFNDGNKAVAYWKRYKKAAELPPGAAVKAERDAARLEWAKIKKKRTPRRKGKAEFLAKKASIQQKVTKLTMLYKNVLAIESRIMAIEQGMKLEKEAREEEAKKPST